MLPGMATYNSVSPGTRMAVAAPIAAMAAYYGAPWALGKLLEMTGLGSTAELNDSPRFRSIAAILGALGTMGMIGSGQVANPFRHGTQSFVNSLFDKDYWSKHRDQMNMEIERKRKQIQDVNYRPKGTGIPGLQSKGLGFVLPGLDKIGSAGDNLYYRPIIPISKSLQYIQQDPVLNEFQKMHTSQIISGAPEIHKGHTAGVDLTSSALKFGADYGAAYLFGKGVGAVLGMPDPLVTRLSRIGGLGAAVMNSGIFGEH